MNIPTSRVKENLKNQLANESVKNNLMMKFGGSPPPPRHPKRKESSKKPITNSDSRIKS